MAQILYSRQADQPDILYLPLPNGSFIQLVPDSHTYPDAEAIALKNSMNPTVQNLLKTGNISIMVDQNVSVSMNDMKARVFAPLSMSDLPGNRNIASFPGMINNTTLYPTSVIEPLETVQTVAPELIQPKPKAEPVASLPLESKQAIATEPTPTPSTDTKTAKSPK